LKTNCANNVSACDLILNR